MIAKPTTGPRITRAKEEIKDLLNEKTLRRVNAIPKDIKIKKIVAYINKNLLFSTNTVSSMS